MPHGFPFYGETYGEISAARTASSSSAATGRATITTTSLPQAGLPALIAPFWDAFLPHVQGGNVYLPQLALGLLLWSRRSGGVAIEFSCGV